MIWFKKYTRNFLVAQTLWSKVNRSNPTFCRVVTDFLILKGYLTNKVLNLLSLLGYNKPLHEVVFFVGLDPTPENLTQVLQSSDLASLLCQINLLRKFWTCQAPSENCTLLSTKTTSNILENLQRKDSVDITFKSPSLKKQCVSTLRLSSKSPKPSRYSSSNCLGPVDIRQQQKKKNNKCCYVSLANWLTHNAKLIYVDKKLSLTQTTYVTQTKRARTATALLAAAAGAIEADHATTLNQHQNDDDVLLVKMRKL